MSPSADHVPRRSVRSVHAGAPLSDGDVMAGRPTVAVVHVPSGGHVRPLLPLVGALRARGARTVQVALPEWEAECVAVGGDFCAGPDFGIDVSQPPTNLIAVAEMIAHAAERVTPWLTERLRDMRADVVLRDSFALHGHYAAIATGTPEVAFSPMMALHRGMRPSPRNVPSALGALVLGVPAAVRLRRVSRRLERRYGAPLGSPLDVLAGRYGCKTLVGTSRELQGRHEGLAGEDVRFVGPLRAASDAGVGEEAVLADLGDDEELVYVSLGTVFERRPSFFRVAASALARPGRRVVLSVGRIAPQSLGPLPAGVIAQSHVNQPAVLSRTNLFVTHGGFNGVQEALVAGAPMLLVPQMQEQALNADRVIALGAGLRLRRPTLARLAAMADVILAGREFRDAARSAGAGLRAAADLDGAADAVLTAALRGRSPTNAEVASPRGLTQRGEGALDARDVLPVEFEKITRSQSMRTEKG